MKTTFMDVARYFVTFINDFSTKVWLYALKSKRECFEKFKEFKALINTQSKHKIKAFQSDNIGVFISKVLKQFLKNHDIEKQMSITYKLQQNEVAECANCTIVEMTKDMLHVQNLYNSFWADVVAYAVYT